MLGLMQDRPLMISSLLEHAARFHPHTEIVSRTPEGPMHRTTWGALLPRAKQAANALAQLGVQAGDRVATLAWNSHRHLTLYYGVSGMIVCLIMIAVYFAFHESWGLSVWFMLTFFLLYVFC